MIKKYLLLSLAAFLLTACGGGSSNSVFDNNGDGDNKPPQEEIDKDSQAGGGVHIPRQDRLSIAIETFNPAAFNVDGVQVNITVTAADFLGNYVPDGTTVFFTAESGAMEHSCVIAEGQCTAVWKSGGTRPGGYDASLELVNEQIGMTTILAHTYGEAGFTDSNANNVFDIGESFVSYAEPFIDNNWNGRLDIVNSKPVERFIDTNSDNVHSEAPAFYQGTACSEEAKAAGHCASLMHVRDQTRIVQSLQNSVFIKYYTCTPDPIIGLSGCNEMVSLTVDPAGGEFWVVLQDENENIPAAGATLEVKGEGYKITGNSGVVKNSIGELSAGKYAGSGLPNYGALYHVIYTPDGTPKSITLTATSGDEKVEL